VSNRYSRDVIPTDQLFFIGGPDVIEDEKHALRHAASILDVCYALGIFYIYKSSYDKANRTSIKSYRGPGIKGLEILKKVRDKLNIPVLTDVHSPEEATIAAKYVDVIQIPAFLCRQTDLLLAAAKTQKPLHIKKAQFCSPIDMKNVITKVRSVSKHSQIILAERGVTFGYNNLVVDMRSIPIMKELGCPVVIDAGHSVQQPSAAKGGTVSGGDRKMIPIIAKAGIAAGADGIFMEVHEDPDNAPCDGTNSVKLNDLYDILDVVHKIWMVLHE